MTNIPLPSPEQQTIQDFFRTSPSSLIINAVAGSGKTTTLCQLANFLPLGRRHTFLAFNKGIATELSERLPASLSAATFHSTLLRAFQPKPKVDDDKTAKYLKSVVPKKLFRDLISPCCKLVSIAKNSNINPTSTECDSILSELMLDYDISCEEPIACVSFAKGALVNALEDPSFIDFDDMLWLPLHFPAFPFPLFDTIFIDEVQDTNEVQRLLLSKLLAPSGRIIAVGDPNQAIYQFRGATSDAYHQLQSQFNMTEFPLSVSYRCSQEVVKEAQRILSL